MDHAEDCADRKRAPDLEPWFELLPGPAVHSDCASLAAFPAPHEHGTAAAVKIALLGGERFVDPESCTPEQDDQRAEAVAVRPVASGSHHRDDLLDRRRVGRVLLALVPWRAASVIARHGRRRATVTCGVQQNGFHESSLGGWVERAVLFEPSRRSSSEPCGSLL